MIFSGRSSSVGLAGLAAFSARCSAGVLVFFTAVALALGAGAGARASSSSSSTALPAFGLALDLGAALGALVSLGSGFGTAVPSLSSWSSTFTASLLMEVARSWADLAVVWTESTPEGEVTTLQC